VSKRKPQFCDWQELIPLEKPTGIEIRDVVHLFDDRAVLDLASTWIVLNCNLPQTSTQYERPSSPHNMQQFSGKVTHCSLFQSFLLIRLYNS